MDAALVWDDLNVDEALLAEMLASLKVWRETDQWKRRRVIPNPDTWLKGRRWTDIGIDFGDPPPLTPAQIAAENRAKREATERERQQIAAERAARNGTPPLRVLSEEQSA